MATQYGDWGSIKTNRANYRLYVTYSITEAADSYTVNLTEIGVQVYSKTYRTVVLIGTWDVLVNGSVIWSSGSGSGTEVPTNKDGVTRSNYIARLTGLSKKIAKTHSSQTAYVTFRGVNVKPECLSDNGWVGGVERGPAVTASAPINPKTTYTISFNTQGGSGSFGNLTKWHGEPLTIHSGKPTKANYTFVNWKISITGTINGTTYVNDSAGTIDPGKQISAGLNGNCVLNAQWKIITYPVTFDANGGTGGPVNTTKNSGSALTFSSAKPVKTDSTTGKAYDFLGWAETSAPNTIVYPVGNTTIAANVNRPVNLIAVWREHYYSPTITNTKIFRCNENSQASDEGGYAYVSFDWAVDNWKYPTNTASEVKVTVGDIAKTIPEAVDQLSGSVAVKIGSPVGKNLLPYPYASSNANKTVNGVTFTVTDKGILTVAGTPTAGVGFVFSKNLIDAIGLKAGDEIYVSTGAAYNAKAYFRLLYEDTKEGITRIDVDVKKVTITDAMVTRGLWFELWIPAGNDSISITFKPMVSFSSDGTYEPYKKQLFDVDTEYPVTISVADKQASTETLYKTTVTGRLNVAEYPLDFGSAVNSIGVFKPASDEAEYDKVMDVGGDVKIDGDLFIRGVELTKQLLQEFTDLNTILRVGTASNLSMSNWKTVNCSGSITTSLANAHSGYYINLSGRIAITNFSRTGANPGASCQLGVKPKNTFTQTIGFRAENPREYMFVTVDTNGLATFRTSETYTNASGSTLTFIIPNWIVNFNN